MWWQRSAGLDFDPDDNSVDKSVNGVDNMAPPRTPFGEKYPFRSSPNRFFSARKSHDWIRLLEFVKCVFPNRLNIWASSALASSGTNRKNGAGIFRGRPVGNSLLGLIRRTDPMDGPYQAE